MPPTALPAIVAPRVSGPSISFLSDGGAIIGAPVLRLSTVVRKVTSSSGTVHKAGERPSTEGGKDGTTCAARRSPSATEGAAIPVRGPITKVAKGIGAIREGMLPGTPPKGSSQRISRTLQAGSGLVLPPLVFSSTPRPSTAKEDSGQAALPRKIFIATHEENIRRKVGRTRREAIPIVITFRGTKEVTFSWGRVPTPCSARRTPMPAMLAFVAATVVKGQARCAAPSLTRPALSKGRAFTGKGKTSYAALSPVRPFVIVQAAVTIIYTGIGSISPLAGTFLVRGTKAAKGITARPETGRRLALFIVESRT